jgi:hypothetical protein
MNNINNYILEKLHLNKDIEVSSDNLLKDILDFCNIKTPKYSEKNYNIIKDAIEKWIDDNGVSVVDMYTQDTTEGKKHMSKIADEIKNKVHVIDFSEFYNLFIGPFPKGTNFDDIKLCRIGNIDIYGNKKALSVQTSEFSLLVLKLK